MKTAQELMYHSAINFKFLHFTIYLNFRLSLLDCKLQTIGPSNFKQHLIKNVKKKHGADARYQIYEKLNLLSLRP